jgi:hypothetical protein
LLSTDGGDGGGEGVPGSGARGGEGGRGGRPGEGGSAGYIAVCDFFFQARGDRREESQRGGEGVGTKKPVKIKNPVFFPRQLSTKFGQSGDEGKEGADGEKGDDGTPGSRGTHQKN